MFILKEWKLNYTNGKDVELVLVWLHISKIERSTTSCTESENRGYVVVPLEYCRK